MSSSKPMLSVLMAAVLFLMPLNEIASAGCSGGTASATCNKFKSCTRDARDSHGIAIGVCNRVYTGASAGCAAAYAIHQDEETLAQCLAAATTAYWTCKWAADYTRDRRISNCCDNHNSQDCPDYSNPCPGYLSECG